MGHLGMLKVRAGVHCAARWLGLERRAWGAGGPTNTEQGPAAAPLNTTAMAPGRTTINAPP